MTLCKELCNEFIHVSTHAEIDVWPNPCTQPLPLPQAKKARSP